MNLFNAGQPMKQENMCRRQWVKFSGEDSLRQLVIKRTIRPAHVNFLKMKLSAKKYVCGTTVYEHLHRMAKTLLAHPLPSDSLLTSIQHYTS